MATKTTNKKKAELPRRDETILKFAAQAFRTYGYPATSMQRIADAAGLQKASLYHHFPSKDDILSQIVETASHLLLEPLEAIAAGPEDPPVRLRKAIENHIRVFCAHPDEEWVLLYEARHFSKPLERQLRPVRERYQSLFRQLVREGMDGGYFKPRDPVLVTNGIFGMCNWLGQWYRPDGPLKPEQVTRQLADLALAALRPDKPDKLEKADKA